VATPRGRTTARKVTPFIEGATDNAQAGIFFLFGREFETDFAPTIAPQRVDHKEDGGQTGDEDFS
jgi:hypothetical protein